MPAYELVGTAVVGAGAATYLWRRYLPLIGRDGVGTSANSADDIARAIATQLVTTGEPLAGRLRIPNHYALWLQPDKYELVHRHWSDFSESVVAATNTKATAVARRTGKTYEPLSTLTGSLFRGSKVAVRVGFNPIADLAEPGDSHSDTTPTPRRDQTVRAHSDRLPETSFDVREVLPETDVDGRADNGEGQWIVTLVEDHAGQDVQRAQHTFGARGRMRGVIGRKSSDGFVVTSALATVSKSHGAVTVTGPGELTYVDNSKTGSYLVRNGARVRIARSVVLLPGDRVELGHRNQASLLIDANAVRNAHHVA